MRYFILLVLVVGLASALGAASLSDLSLEQGLKQARVQRTPDLFETREIAFTGATGMDRLVRAQAFENGGRETDEQMYGAGAALGLNLEAIGFGAGGWFDFYFQPYIAVSALTTVAYGINGHDYHDGGDALFFSMSLGAKFVLDFPDIEINDWFRPFAAFYPVGFAYIAGTEDAEEGSRTREVKYSDLYFMMAGGIGADFFLTHLIGVGFGFYVYGTIGGSRHKHTAGIETRTEGNVSAFIEFARINLRF